MKKSTKCKLIYLVIFALIQLFILNTNMSFATENDAIKNSEIVKEDDNVQSGEIVKEDETVQNNEKVQENDTITEEEAEKNLGAPIFSRFSKVIKFNSISVDDKLKIAKKCYDGLMAELQDEDKELIIGIIYNDGYIYLSTSFTSSDIYCSIKKVKLVF